MMAMVWARSVWYLMRKERGAQRNNFVFLLAGVVLSGGVLWAISKGVLGFENSTPAEACALVIYVIIVPVFVFLLPIMAGATAAASDKALGTDAWHDALPAGRGMQLLAKYVISTALVVLSAGVVPLLLTVGLPDSVGELLAEMFVMGTPVLIGLLAGGAGYLGGTLMRRDYQGLFVGVGIMGLFYGVSVITDFHGASWPAQWLQVVFPDRFTALLFVLKFVGAGVAMYLLADKAAGFPRQASPYWRSVPGLLVIVIVFGIVSIYIVSKASTMEVVQKQLPYKVRLADGRTARPFHYLGYMFPYTLGYLVKNEKSFYDSRTDEDYDNHFVMGRDGWVHRFYMPETYDISKMSPSGRWAIIGKNQNPNARYLTDAPKDISSERLTGPLGVEIGCDSLPTNFFHYFTESWQPPPSDDIMEDYRPLMASAAHRWNDRFPVNWGNDDAFFQQHCEQVAVAWTYCHDTQNRTQQVALTRFPAGAGASDGQPLIAVGTSQSVRAWVDFNLTGVTSDLVWGHEQDSAGNLRFYPLDAERYRTRDVAGPAVDPVVLKPDWDTDGLRKYRFIGVTTVPVFRQNDDYVMVLPYEEVSVAADRDVGVVLFDPVAGQRNIVSFVPGKGKDVHKVAVTSKMELKPGKTVQETFRDLGSSWWRVMLKNDKLVVMGMSDGVLAYGKSDDWFRPDNWTVNCFSIHSPYQIGYYANNVYFMDERTIHRMVY